jgi:filamentous hemagglutinin
VLARTGSGDINLQSGRDSNLKGAVVSGDAVLADVGETSISSLCLIPAKVPIHLLNSGSALGDCSIATFAERDFTGRRSRLRQYQLDQRAVRACFVGLDGCHSGGKTHLGAGKIISESGDLVLDTGTLTFENFNGTQGYEGFDVTANIDLSGKGAQRPDQTSQPRNSVEGSYQLDDSRQEVRATAQARSSFGISRSRPHLRRKKQRRLWKTSTGTLKKPMKSRRTYMLALSSISLIRA